MGRRAARCGPFGDGRGRTAGPEHNGGGPARRAAGRRGSKSPGFPVAVAG